MISLHKILEQNKRYQSCLFNTAAHLTETDTPRGQMTQNNKKKIDSDLFNHLAKSAVCFYIDSPESYQGLSSSLKFQRLPYEICWFETPLYINFQNGDTLNFKRGALLREHFIDGEYTISGFLLTNKTQDKKWAIDQCFTTKVGSGDVFFHYLYENMEERNIKDRVEVFLQLIDIFLQAKSCKNVTSVKNNPPEKLNKKRIKNGKVPLFSYWTLNLDFGNPVTSGENGGGTHASPRLHLRRGHAREYSPGKFTWVQPTVVGNKKIGVVMKDYKVSGLTSNGITG